MTISSETTIEEIAALVFAALEREGIEVVLSGGAAVTFYSDNEYMSSDLDFITTERKKRLDPVMTSLGFQSRGREYTHPDSTYFVEFPSGPLAFGDRYVGNEEATILETEFGPIRIVTPTQSVMDRLAWFVHGRDHQSRDQAVMVAKRQEIDWQEVFIWARNEGIEDSVVHALRVEAEE
jgi:hypothetical protein